MSHKVLFLSESQGWSGGAKQLLRLASLLRGSGWDVRIACPGDGETHRRSVEAGLPTLDLHPREDYDLPTALRVARLIDREGIDILHAHHPRAHAVGLIASYLARRPVVFVVTRRVSFPPKRNPFSRFKYTSRRIDGFVAVAESIRQNLISGGVEPERVVTIPSGVELSDFSPRPRDAALAAELRLPEGVPVVAKIANYGPWKGQDLVLEAAAQLKREGRRAVYVFAGRDTDGETIRRKAESLGLGSDDVRFLGLFKDVPRLLSLVDVSLNAATEGEGISGALRESLAMEVPSAASDAGGNRELIEDGVTGRIFPRGDASAIAKAVAGLLDDRDGARRMARAGRRLVEQRFTWESVVPANAAFYRSLLAKRRGTDLSASATPRAASSTGMSRQDSHDSEVAPK